MLIHDRWENVTLGSTTYDLIYTDPPYGQNYKTQISGDPHWNKSGKTKTFNIMEGDSNILNWSLFAYRMYQCLKPNSYLVMHGNQRLLAACLPVLESHGFNYHGTIVWNKKSSIGGNLFGALRRDWEPVFYFGKGKAQYQGNKRLSEVTGWEYTTKRSEYVGHPTQKPLDLCKRIINLFCPPYGEILDPFAGSGTIGLAALKTGRQCTSIECDKRYFDILKTRLTDS
jgi:site-specific DNA-methyltransferase (adenine-specific)